MPGNVRVIVSRTRAEMVNCPNWSAPSQFNYNNTSMPNYGCAVNGNLAAMAANPQDLFSGRDGSGVGDTQTASQGRRILSQGQRRPARHGLQDISTKKDK